MSVKMVITLSDNGVQVDGPLGSKPLCKAMLAGAEEIVEHPEKYQMKNNVMGSPAASGPVRSN